MVLSFLLVFFILSILFFPYTLTLLLRLFFHRIIKSISVRSIFSYTNIRLQIQKSSIKLKSITFSYVHSKIMIHLQNIQADIHPSSPSPPSPPSELSVIRSIFIRMLLSIFSKYFIVKLENLNLSVNEISVKTDAVLINFNLEEPSALIETKCLISNLSIISKDFKARFLSIIAKVSVPGVIYLKSAIQQSEISVEVGSIDFQMCSVPVSSGRQKPSLLIPSKINLTVHEVNLDILSLATSIHSIYFSLNPFNLDIGLVAGKESLSSAIFIPNLKVSEENEAIKINSSYIRLFADQIIPIIIQIVSQIEPPPVESPRSGRVKPISLNLQQIDIHLPGKGLVLEFSNFKLTQDLETSLSISEISIISILFVKNFKLLVSELVDISLQAIDLRLNEETVKDIVSYAALTFRSLPPSKQSKPANKKPVRLQFETISAYGHYVDDFKIYITVEKFAANIKHKEFDLFFYNSNIYDMETKKLHIVTTTICKVKKYYEEGVAKIFVLGDEIGIFLPRKYFLAQAVLKFLKGTHKVYKWCKFEFLQVQRSYTYVAERAQHELTFKNFRFIAEDDPVDYVNIKKYHINSEEDIYNQLKALQMVNSLLTLTCSSAVVKLNNFELDNLEKLRRAIEDLDEWNMPYEEFFAVILAYDFTCVGRKVVINIRDYPYDFCKINTVKFGGRSILTKNRIMTPIWAQYKHHSIIEVVCNDVTAVAGICLLKVLMDLIRVGKYIFLLKSRQNLRKLDFIDFLRYFLHGSMKVTLNGLQTMILKTPSPYFYEFINFDIALCEMDLRGELFNICSSDLILYKEQTCIMKLPVVKIEIAYELFCKKKNHWIVTNNIFEKIDDFILENINVKGTVSIFPAEKNFSIYYYLVDSAIIDNLLTLYTNPPVYLIPYRERSPARFFKKFSKVSIAPLKIVNLDVFIILNYDECESQVACFKIPVIHLSADCVLQLENTLVPFLIPTAAGTCCNISLAQIQEQEEKSLLKCQGVDYNYSNTENHQVHIEGFEVFLCNFFINLITELVLTQPEGVKKLMNKKKRSKAKKFGIKRKKITSRVIIRGVIASPIISILSEEDDSRIIIKGGEGEFDIIEDTLKFDTLHKDTKKKVNFLLKSIECFVDKREEHSCESKIFNSKDIAFNLTLFTMPFNTIDYARNCMAADEFVWYKEKRINRLDFNFPEVNSSIESEDFWILIDIIKGYIGYIPKNQVSYSERLMEDEFKIYGGKEIVRKLNENIKKSINNKPSESKIVSINLRNLNVTLKRGLDSIISLDLLNFRFIISTFSDKSCQKSLEIHKITMKSGNTTMICPLLPNNEEYLPSNTMITLRILDRWVEGFEVYWPIIDHLEFLVYPLNINFSKDIYKELYSFFFTEDKEKSEKKLKRVKLPRLYKYVHINEIKICITVTGWIPLHNSKITLKAFTRQNKFKTLQGIFDKIMKHELKNVISQVPSICIQNLGIAKKNFLPTTETAQRSNSFLDKLKRNKSDNRLNSQEIQKREGIKLMFGKDFK